MFQTHFIRPTRSGNRRGTTVLAAVWAIAIGATIAASVQLFGWRQAMMSQDVVQRIQSRWAARAGVENTIAVMADFTDRPEPDDAFAMVREMEFVSAGDVGLATYTIRHWRDDRHWAGPLDEHSRFNVNLVSEGDLMLLDDMTIDVASAMIDWRDEDNEPSLLGVEEDYYRALESPYDPRNDLIRTIAELELVAGIWPEYLRGEDWNLNYQLDPNENDESATWPRDNVDGRLDGGWSQYLTAYSLDYGATASGDPRIWLRGATPEELVDRLGVDELQAEKLLDFGENLDNQLEQLAVVELSEIDENGNVQQQQQQQPGQPGQPGGQPQPQPGLDANLVPPLTEAQVLAVLQETSVVHPATRPPGRININTIPQQYLRDLLGDEALADEIIFLRDSRAEGIVSMLDLREIPGLTDEIWLQLAQRFDTVSNIYTIVSRGRSNASGITIDMIVVVDRSTLPVRILEYREQ